MQLKLADRQTRQPWDLHNKKPHICSINCPISSVLLVKSIGLLDYAAELRSQLQLWNLHKREIQ